MQRIESAFVVVTAAPGDVLVQAGEPVAIVWEPMLGAETAVNRATVRIGGRALRHEASLLREQFARAGVLHWLLLRHADALICQICAVAACESAHGVRQRLIRWLLSFDDRVRLQHAELTQESLSQLMGVGNEFADGYLNSLQAPPGVVADLSAK